MKFSDLKLPKNCKDLSMKTDSLRQIYDSIKFEELFEPVQMREIIKGKMNVVITNHLDLIAWQKEIAYSGIIKMRKTENSILQLLKNNDLYSVFILLRHHMENAGLLTLSVDILLESLNNDDFEKLNKYISKTWFGNSFFNKPMFRESDEAFGAIETITVSAMIKSMDNFINNVSKTSKEKISDNPFSKNYSWLSQFAHPNSASSCFFTTTSQTNNGTDLVFNWDGNFVEDVGIEKILNMLFFNISVGLANYFLLNSYKFQEDMTVTQDNEIAMRAYFEILNRFENKNFA